MGACGSVVTYFMAITARVSPYFIIISIPLPLLVSLAAFPQLPVFTISVLM
jgi:hypothetical protein